MKCPSEIELNEYAEGRLATERRWDVQRHLNDCPGCRTDLEGLSWATVVMDALHDDDQPEDTHPSPEDLAAMKERRLPPVRRAEVLAHLSTCPECSHIYGALPQPKTEFALLRHWQPLAAAAGILIAIAVAFFGMQDGMVSIGQAPQAVVREAQPPADQPQPVAKAPAISRAAQEGLQAEAATESAPPAPAAAVAATDSTTASENVRGSQETAPPSPPSPQILAFDGGRGPAPFAPVAEAFDESPLPTAPAAVSPVRPQSPVSPPAAPLPPPPAPGTRAVGVTKVWPPEAPTTTDEGIQAQEVRPAMVAPSRAGTGGMGALSTESATSTDTAKAANKLKHTHAQLLAERNDPAAKAKIKGELRDTVEQDQSELGQEQTRPALERLDAPASPQALCASSHTS